MKALIVLLVLVSSFTTTHSLMQQVASEQEILTFINGNNIVIQEVYGDPGNMTTNVYNIDFCGNNSYSMTVTTIQQVAGYPDRTTQENLQGYWKFHLWEGYNCIHYNKKFQGRTLIHALLRDRNGGLKLYGNQSISNRGRAGC